MHKKDVNCIWHSAISQGFIDNPTYTDDSFMPCVTINPSNYEVLPCPECEEMNASEKYPNICNGANLKHISIAAGISSPKTHDASNCKTINQTSIAGSIISGVSRLPIKRTVFLELPFQ